MTQHRLDMSTLMAITQKTNTEGTSSTTRLVLRVEYLMLS